MRKFVETRINMLSPKWIGRRLGFLTGRTADDWDSGKIVSFDNDLRTCVLKVKNKEIVAQYTDIIGEIVYVD